VVQQPIKILIIEDDDDQRELMRETLEDHFGVGTVVGAESGNAAIAHNLSGFDLILSDYNLPDRTGMALLEEIKARCSTPVIMVTGENVGQIAVEAIRRGATDYVVKFGDYLFTIPLVVEKNLTVAKVKRDKEALQKQLEEKNTQLEAALRRVEEVAATDPLTGLYNRRHFGKVLEQLWAEASRFNHDLSCVMIDLDGFKQINDAYQNHQLGDQVLVTAAKVITANLRSMDVAARYGGDEFIVLLPETTAVGAEKLGVRIRQRVEAAVLATREQPVSTTVSIGIAAYPEHASDLETVMERADQALYASKTAGKNRVTVAPSRVHVVAATA
jgi:two-component system cell cycle response regulator